jgi:16S rRNA (adenine1518-N6/adenine1519-N6)-dimethyltransferase
VTHPRALLEKYGFHAKKSWGQNFLVSERVYDAIVRATVRAPDEWVVEIGAGLGTLTSRLADALPDGRLFAIERDRDMVSVLRAELAGRGNVEIVEANALTYDFAALGRVVSVCGNLPYQIASPLLFHVIDARAHVRRAVVMLQKEMADRLVARPGTPAYGALGVMIGTYADVRTVVRAPAGAFFPAPKVDSAVVEIAPLPAPRAPISDEKSYGDVVHAAFGQRRKTLRNALRARFDADAVERALAATGLDGGRRGETLSIPEFAALAGALGA